MLQAKDADGRRAQEERLTEYVKHCSRIMGRAVETVKGKMAAVGTAHVLAGLGNPTQGQERLTRSLQTLRREEGARERKLPAGPNVVETARKIADEQLPPEDAEIIKTALNTGMGFMLRGGEFLVRDSTGYVPDKVLRGADLEVKKM